MKFLLKILLFSTLISSILMLIPYSPYILLGSLLIYLYLIIRKSINQHKIKEEEPEEEVERREDFIDRQVDTLRDIYLSTFLSYFILAYVITTSKIPDNITLSLILLPLCGVLIIGWLSPHHEDERRWRRHYKKFCADYMQARYQEFSNREENNEYHLKRHKEKWEKEQGKPKHFEEKRIREQRSWADRRTKYRETERRQPEGDRRFHLPYFQEIRVRIFIGCGDVSKLDVEGCGSIFL